MTAPPGRASDPAGWVDAHADFLFRFAFLRVRDRDAAEELVQETFVAALQARDRFAGTSSERTWLTGILKHKIVDHWRRSRREPPAGDIDAWVSGSDDAFQRTGNRAGHWIRERGPADWGETPAAALEREEFWRVFERCLAELPPRLAAAFTLREVEEYAGEAICKELDVTPTNLFVMLHRARKRLRQCLERQWFEGQAG